LGSKDQRKRSLNHLENLVETKETREGEVVFLGRGARKVMTKDGKRRKDKILAWKIGRFSRGKY